MAVAREAASVVRALALTLTPALALALSLTLTRSLTLALSLSLTLTRCSSAVFPRRASRRASTVHT